MVVLDEGDSAEGEAAAEGGKVGVGYRFPGRMEDEGECGRDGVAMEEGDGGRGGGASSASWEVGTWRDA
jgi:hypothetical protein